MAAETIKMDSYRRKGCDNHHLLHYCGSHGIEGLQQLQQCFVLSVSTARICSFERELTNQVVFEAANSMVVSDLTDERSSSSEFSCHDPIMITFRGSFPAGADVIHIFELNRTNLNWPPEMIGHFSWIRESLPVRRRVIRKAEDGIRVP
jgi:hypothetical protein